MVELQFMARRVSVQASSRCRTLYPINSFFSKQAIRSHEQEQQRHHVGEPPLDAATNVWPEIHLGKFLQCTDDQPADDGAEYGFEAAQDKHRQGLQRYKSQRVLHAVARTP